MKGVRSVSTSLLLCSLTFYACSAPPDEQLQLAQKAMNEAKAQYASDFAAGDWSNAQQAWDEAQKSLADSRYSEARTQLLRAKSRFERARDIAKAKRDTMLKEVEGLQGTVDSRYQELKSRMASRRIPSALKKKLDASLQEIDQAIRQAKSQVEGGDYLQARKSTETAMRLVFAAEKDIGSSSRRPRT
jgi:hypothetical protein